MTLRRTAILFSFACLLTASPYHYSYADEYTDPEVDIPEDWLGAHVSAKFGIEDAVHDHDGVIETFIGNPIMFMGNTVGDGELSASVVGSGNGTVHSKAGLYYHTADGSNLGTSSQSQKPFTVEGSGTINTSITIDFDGLMVVDEQSVNAADWSQSIVEYLAEIKTVDGDDGLSEVDGARFEGTAQIMQYGNGAAPTIVVPETIVTEDEDDGPDAANDWYDNINLVINKVVAAGAGAGEINVGALTGDTQTAAQNYLNDGRNVYFLTYSQTFNFNAVGGQTYYVHMDLFTGVNASDDPGFAATAYAVSDFSNTVSYDLAGGTGITTSLLFDDDQVVGGDDAFGGATSIVNLDNATLNFTGNNTLNEDIVLIDATDNVLNTNANTDTIAGDISGSGSLTKSGAGTLILSGDNTYSGGTNISAGTVQTNAVNVMPTEGTINISAGALLDLNNNSQSVGGIGGVGDITTGGATLTVGGTTAPGNSIGTLTINGGAYTQAAGSSFEAEFNDAGNSDLLDITGGGTATIQAGATLVPVAMDRITAGQNYIFMSADGGITGAFDTIQDNYAVLNFDAAKINGDTDYQLTVSRSSYASAVAGNSSTAGIAQTLDAILAAGAPAEMDAFMEELDLMSPAEINEAYETLTPDVTGSSINSANSTTNIIQNIIGGRTASVRSGVSGGDLISNGAVWGQGFYGLANQGRDDGVDGYDSNTRGFATGADGDVSDGLRLGIAYGYGNTNSKGDTTSLDADGYTAMAYGSYDAAKWYIDAMASFGWYDYDSRRNTVAGTAEGSYDGQQYALRLDAGCPQAVENLVLTPTASLRYSHLNLDDYQESGTPGANLAVDSQSFDTLTAGIGAKASGELESDSKNWAVSPEVHAGLTYDVVQDDVASAARFVAAGPAFETDGLTPSRAALELGAGLTFSNNNGLDVLVNYEGQFRSEYDGHTGILRLRQNF